jgi:uncharacterized membrane protein YbhN (UPF0104 family)
MKALLRWGVLAVAIAVLTHALVDHWAEVIHLQLRPYGGGLLALSLGATGLAQVWSGWVWGWLLQSLGHPVSSLWSTLIYLRTNLWKYLPGNVWHFYGRLRALRTQSVPPGTALAAVVLDPILMAAAALLIGLLGGTRYWGLQALGVGLVLVAISPTRLNPWIGRLSRAKAQSAGLTEKDYPDPAFSKAAEGLTHYPIKPLLGEIGFVLLRGAGFVLAMAALSPLQGIDLPMVISRFSLAWGLGLIVPGAPGGIGVFEAAAISLLQDPLSAGVVLGGVALYRVISTLTEALGYGMAVVALRLWDQAAVNLGDN